MAMLALKVLRVMEQRLGGAFGTTETNPEAETADSALTALSRLSLEHYTLGEQKIIGLPRPGCTPEANPGRPQRQARRALAARLV